MSASTTKAGQSAKGPSASSLPIPTAGSGGRRMSGSPPSPPSSPTQTKSDIASPLTPLPVSAASVHELVLTLRSLAQYADVVDSLHSVSDAYKQACETHKQACETHMSIYMSIEAEKKALAQQLEAHSATLQAAEEKTAAAEEKTAAAEKAQRDAAAAHDKDVQARQAALDERGRELKKSRADLAASELKLGEEKTRAETCRKAEAAAVAARRTLEADVERMRKGNAELKALQDCLLPPAKMAPAVITRHLDEIFDAAYKVVYACFSQNLSEHVFAADAWRAFKKQFQASAVPLPASNKPDAKAMRIAAVMQYLADVAADELFQPVYVSGSRDDIGAMLTAIKSPRQADVVRRALLKGIASSREDEEDDDEEDDDDSDDDSDIGSDSGSDADDIYKQTAAGARAATVVKDVLELVDGLLDPAQAADFGAALTHWARTTADVWETKLQPLEQRIDTLSLSDVGGGAAGGGRGSGDDNNNNNNSSSNNSNSARKSCWTALAYASQPPSASASARPRSYSIQASSSSSVRRSSVSTHASPPPPPSSLDRPQPMPPMALATASSTSPSAPVDLADISFPIWPVFLLVGECKGKEADKADKQKKIVVRRGVVVTKKQAARALEEDQQAMSLHRTRRHLERAARAPPKKKRRSQSTSAGSGAGTVAGSDAGGGATPPFLDGSAAA